jgi:predicted nucleotidyltransferase
MRVEGKMEEQKAKRKQMLQMISEMRQEFSNRFSVRRIGVFGSFARSDEGPDSDVDIIVELEEPTFDHYMDLNFRLEELLGRSVALVLADTVKSRLKPIIDREVIYA